MKKIAIIVILTFSIIISPITVAAHSATLDVGYDDCIPDGYGNGDMGDGYNEKWYEFTKDNTTQHIPHVISGVTEIKYYFSPTGEGSSSTTWTTGISTEMSNLILNSFRLSMEKWNNIAVYKLNSNGIYEKNKIVYLVEGTVTDHNLIIYPSTKMNSAARTKPTSDAIEVTSVDGTTHNHYTKWQMEINAIYISSFSNEKRNLILSRTGAHEIGHILGLRDIDSIENKNDGYYHHEEILMGYEQDSMVSVRQSEITYRDIAGVSITRGLHTDNDHLWLYDSENSNDSQHKLICSLCNCVKYVVNLDSYEYYIYKQCGHSENSSSIIVDENMIPVASYGNKDYYKCKYCRVVAPFNSRINQNYVFSGERNNTHHILENDTDLNYTVIEEHNIINIGNSNYKCSGCTYRIINTYETYTLSNYSSTVNKTINLNANEHKYYKLVSNYDKYYEILLYNSNNMDLKLYDEDFNQIDSIDFNSANSINQIIEQLSLGIYYLELINNNTFSSSVSLKIASRNSIYLSVGNNDILLNGYNNVINYTYGNSSGKGLYKFTVAATLLDGTQITYTNSLISIYSDSNREQLVPRLETIHYVLDSQASSGSNNLITFLEQGEVYYININLPNIDYNTLYLNIEKIDDVQEVDMFNYIEDEYETEEILDEDISHYGDYIQKIEIKQDGIYDIIFIHNGPQNEYILNGQENPEYLYYVFYKEITSPIEEKGNLELLLPHAATTVGNSCTFEFTLSKGIYYIGYHNKFNMSPMTISIGYNINVYDDTKIISDPLPLNTCGSMINIYEKDIINKSFRGNNVIVGFTRLLYLAPILEVDTRLDYSWYSSNKEIATVSEFGTIFGKSAGIVKIMAVNKENPKIIYLKTFNIINDTSEDMTEKITYSNDTHNVIDGVYKLGLTAQNCPYPSVYLYNWEIISYDTSITKIEYVESGYYDIEGYGNIIIKGSNYSYNNKYSVQINLIVS